MWFVKAVSFDCTLCTKKFNRKSGLNDHISSHIGLKEFKCDFCDHKATLKSNLINHMRTCKNRTGDTLEQYECSYSSQYNCSYTTVRKDSLKSHMRSHQEPKFNCQFCDYKARHKEKLKHHQMKIHSIFKS